MQAINVNQSPNNLFEQAQVLFRQGKLSQSSHIYNKILSQNNNKNHTQTPNLHYDSLLNISTIYLQQNDLEKSRQALKKAIKLNQSRYEAFYNLSIANYYAQKHYNQSIRSLQYCLSLLYLDVGVLTDSMKLLNKSIALNSQNAKAYIHRGLLYEKNQKIKLAENQFEKLTFENDQHQFSNVMLIEIYLQKALFFRRIHKVDKMQENLTFYLKLKNQPQHQQNQLNQTVKKILKDEQKSQEKQQANATIVELLREAQGLIKQIHEEKNRHIQEENKNLNEQRIPQQKRQTVAFQMQRQLLTEEKSQQPNTITIQQYIISEQDLLKETDFPQQKHHNQSNPSISFNQDEDSAILNQKIQQLQRQIKQSGGNVPEIKDLSRNSEEQNFLQFQIEKTIEQINNKKKEQNEKRKQQSTALRSSLQAEGKSTISSPGSQNRKSERSDDRHDTLTLRSKISQTYEMNLDQIRDYKSFQLQIRSASMFDQKGARKQAYIKIRYLSKDFATDKCKDDKFTWNHNFDEETMKHGEDDDETMYQLGVELHAKEGGWLSWHQDVILGSGVVKLTEKGGTKCTLEKDGEKVGMVYYKIKLKKSKESEKDI